MNTEEKKIAVIGIGGVGGYIAGLLAKAYPHVTMVARGARAESIRKKGLVLHSDYKGEIVAKPERVIPIQDMGQQDYIFICVKNYSLAEVCESIRDMVTDNTVIIPVMNGVDPGENIRRLVGKGTVVDSLIYTVAFANEDFSISQQDTFTWLCIGIKDADERQQKKVAEVAGILKGADIDYKDQGDIEVEIWRKYILNCAFNVMTAFYDNTIGELRRDPVKAQQYEKLVWEAASVGQAKGVALTDEHINEVIHKFRYVHADNATSSLQRDFRIRRKQTELETFSGYIVKEAKRLGVSIPLSEKIYQGLMEMAEKELPFEEKIRVLYSISRSMKFMKKNFHGISYDQIEQKCFATIQQEIFRASNVNQVKKYKIAENQVKVSLPVRVNWGGGWTDTPPYCNEKGGVVLNAAILLNGQEPIEVELRKLPEKHIEFASLDLDAWCCDNCSRNSGLP